MRIYKKQSRDIFIASIAWKDARSKWEGANMIYEDDRTEEEKKTHPILVIGTDSFLSGWGHAEGGKSFAAWACKPEDESLVLDWVTSRSDMKRVRVTVDPYRPKCKHLHIYVVNENHPSLNRKKVA